MGPASPYITSRTIHAARNFALFASAGVAVVCAMVLLGWTFDIDALKSGLPGHPSMKANTALCLGLLAITVVVLARGSILGRWGMLLPGLAAGIAILTLAEYVLKADFGIDQALFADVAPSVGPYPGRMSPMTAAAIILLAVALYLQNRGRTFHAIQQAAALLPFVLGLLGATGIIYRFHFLAGIGVAVTMDLHTTTAIMLLSLSILALNPDTGIMRVILANRSGGRFARRMLPVAILFPVAMGWVRMLGQNVGYYDTEFGILIMVLSAITVFSVFAIVSARHLNGSEEVLLDAQQALERRIQERTNDLEATVARLRAEIVRREAAEASQAESEALFRNALEYAPIGMAIVGLDGRWQRVNRAICDIVGYDEQALLQLTFQDITHPDDLDADLALLDSLVKGEIPFYQMEKRYLRKDGKPVWIMLSVSLVRDSTGEPMFFVSQIEDIDIRRQAERDVAAGRQFLGDVINSIPIPLTVKNESGRIIIVNSAMSRFHGKRPEEIVGRTDAELFSEERANIFRTEDQTLLRTGIPLVEEQKFSTITGETRWVIKHKHRIVLSDGSSCVLTTLLDITERKNAEIALRDSEERFRSLTVLSSDWYWEQDENFRFTVQSGGALTAVNISTAATLGKTRWELPYQNTSEAGWRHHREVLENHQPFHDLELTRELDDGSRRYIIVSGEPVFDREGRFKGYRGIGRDITEHRRAEQELADSRQFLSDVINFIPIPVTVKDDSGRMIIVNSAMEKFQNRPAAELVGKSDSEVFSGDRARILRAEDEAVLRTGTAFVQEQKFVTASNDLRWVIKHKQRIVLGDGRRLVIATLLDITERKEAELEVERSQKFLESVIEAIPQPVFLKDSQHRWVLFNSAFCDLLGHDRAALLGRSDPDIYPADWVKRVWAEDDQVLSGNGSVVVEESSESRADGSVRWLLKSKKRVTLPDESTYIVGISTDITRLKQVDEALRTSDELHRLLADNSSDLISLMTPAGAIEYASSASMVMLGRLPEQLIGRVVTEIIHPDDAKQSLQIFTGVVKTQAPVIFTCRLMKADGSWSWIETSFRAIRDAASGRTRQVIAVSRDINERVRVTNALNHFKYVLDNTLDMIFIYDVDTLRFNYVNDGAARALGIPRERLLGMAPWEVRADILEKEYHKSIEPFLKGEIQSRQTETVHRRADGSLMPVEVTMQLIRRPGEVGTFISIARDLTERKKIEQMKNEFVSTVSHELRTPVTSIRGSLGLLASGVAGKIPKRAQQLVDIANNNSERLIRLINDILDIEKIESGKMRFVLHPTGLRGLLETALVENQGYADKFQVHFRMPGEIPDVMVRADPDRILQVMANLLSNAAKFSPRDGHIEISALAGSASVRISVADHGDGIPADFQDKIFGKFSQADAGDSRKLGGTGLGLSIAKAIVEKHGCEIGFTTAPGAGTTFYFDLPLAFASAHDERTEAEPVRNRVH